MVAKPAPNENANEESPRNLRVLDEEPRRIMSFFDPILVASVCHSLVFLRNDLDGFSISQEFGADGDYFFSGLHSYDGNRTLVDLAELHCAQTCCQFAGTFLRHHHREPSW